MIIDIIIPSTRREYRIFDMVKNWIDRAEWKPEEKSHYLRIWVACESEDQRIYSERLEPLKDIVRVAAGHYGCYVAAVNSIAEQTDGDVIIVAADDVVPCLGYDRTIKRAFEQFYPTYDGVLKANDLIHPLDDPCNTHPVIGREYYNRVGYVYYPGYFALWADTDFARTSLLTNRVTMVSTLILEHWHHTAGKTPRDYTHEKPLSHNECGERLFNQREKEGFVIIKDGRMIPPADLFKE